MESTTVLAYHESSKHHLDRYAPSPAGMDWRNQPHPFRSYADVAAFPLPLLREDPTANHAGLYRNAAAESAPLTMAAVAAFLELSLGLSAWKAVQATAAGPCASTPPAATCTPPRPTSCCPGARRPWPPGLYHYFPWPTPSNRAWSSLADWWRRLWAHLGGRAFCVALTSIFWRESWKYGDAGLSLLQPRCGPCPGGPAILAPIFTAGE
jgi:hypothetical protein